ncbi:MAG: hypothetical protein ACFFDN_26110 [Candidatus Hodarchaeota archaeon]
MESEEYEEEEEEEEPSLLDVIATYRHDADKIIILARSIETILHYTERLEENAMTINEYVRYMFDQLNDVISKVGDLETRFKKLVEFQIQSIQQMGPSTNSMNPATEQDLRNQITTMGSKLVDFESVIQKLLSKWEEFQKVAPTAPAAPVVGIPPAPPRPQGAVVEESLLKPSSFKSASISSPAPRGPSPMGGMSVRMAMMSEIKSKLGKRSGTVGPMGGGGGMGPIKKDYVPKIHQPRAAKPIDGSLSKKMNKLLDAKFQMQLGGNVPQGAGPPSAGPPRGPPRAPPGAPPSARPPPPSETDNKKDKKKGKKKDKKKDDTISDRLASIDEALKDKLG